MKAENNPFRSSAVARIRYRIEARGQWALVERLRSNRWRGCILGPEGTGKTTLLEDLDPWIRADGVRVAWIRLTLDSTAMERQESVRRVAAMVPGECCLFDGGEVLGRLAWRRLIRTVEANDCGLVATVHRRCPLPVLHRTGIDLDRAVSLARELAGEIWSEALEAVARTAFQKSGGNCREVFRACYWHCATRKQETQPRELRQPLTPAKKTLVCRYRELRSFQMTTVIYDGTVSFCNRFIDGRSRTHDQMVRTARQGKKSGSQFRGCTGYPDCRGAVSLDGDGKDKNRSDR